MCSKLIIQILGLISLSIVASGNPLVVTILREDNVTTTDTAPKPIVEVAEIYTPGKVIQCGGVQKVRDGETYSFKSQVVDRSRRSPYWYPHQPRFPHHHHGFHYPHPFYPAFVPVIPRPKLLVQPIKPQICKWTFVTSSNCNLVANFDHHEVGDSNCNNQYLLLGDEERESQICGYAQFPGYFKSNGNELFIKHYKKPAAWSSEFHGFVTCIKKFQTELETTLVSPTIVDDDEEATQVEESFDNEGDSILDEEDDGTNNFGVEAGPAEDVDEPEIPSTTTTVDSSSSTTTEPDDTADSLDPANPADDTDEGEVSDTKFNFDEPNSEQSTTTTKPVGNADSINPPDETAESNPSDTDAEVNGELPSETTETTPTVDQGSTEPTANNSGSTETIGIGQGVHKPYAETNAEAYSEPGSESPGQQTTESHYGRDNEYRSTTEAPIPDTTTLVASKVN